jgi:hypothetical protein
MNVLNILDRYNIEYVDHGNNVAKGNVNVQCPWCGSEDHSQHLGINLENGMWGCWRNKAHRGRALFKLLAKLTGMSQQEARRATGEGAARAVQRGDMERAVQALGSASGDAVQHIGASVLHLGSTMRKMSKSDHRVPYKIENRFRQYLLRDRGFGKTDIAALVSSYDLHYCVTGDFANRIIIPVYENGKLMTYLGRSIYPAVSLRYRALEKEKSVKQVKDCVYNYDRAMRGGQTLVMVEGAFDTMKVDYYGRPKLKAVGLFNMNIEDLQMELLYNLRGKFDRYIILLDRGELASSLRLEDTLYFFRDLKTRFLEQVDDPGDLTPKQAEVLNDWL